MRETGWWVAVVDGCGPRPPAQVSLDSFSDTANKDPAAKKSLLPGARSADGKKGPRGKRPPRTLPGPRKRDTRPGDVKLGEAMQAAQDKIAAAAADDVAEITQKTTEPQLAPNVDPLTQLKRIQKSRAGRKRAPLTADDLADPRPPQRKTNALKDTAFRTDGALSSLSDALSDRARALMNYKQSLSAHRSSARQQRQQPKKPKHRPLVVATASSANHFDSLNMMLLSLKAINARVVFYDLGARAQRQ